MVSKILYYLSFVGYIYLLIWINNNINADMASQASLLMLLIGSFTLGMATNIKYAWAPGVVLGSVLAVYTITCMLLNLALPVGENITNYSEALALLVLVIPSLVAAYAGAYIRRFFTTAKY